MLPENDCGFYIKHLHDALQRDGNNALRDQGLTLVQVTVLLQLSSAPEKVLSLKELEKRLHVAQSTAAGIVVRLEQKGFVESFVSRTDKRIKLVRVTESGLDCCAAARQHMEETEAHLLSSLTEAERVIFTTLLKKVSDSME